MSTVSFEHLLNDIPGDSPVGVSQHDPQVLASKFTPLDAMQAGLQIWQGDVTSARFNQLDDPPPHEATWSSLLESLKVFIEQESKDVRLIGRLVTVSTYVHGFEGYSAALRFASELVVKFGDSLPADGRFSRELSRSLSQATSDQIIDALNNYEIAPGVRRIPVIIESITESSFRGSISREQRDTAIQQIEACSVALRQFQDMVRPLVEEVPNATEFMKNLDDFAALFSDDGPNSNGADETFDNEEQSTDAAAAPPNGVLNRKTAVAEIRRIAAFFRSTEPHSPISYGLDRVADWATMELPELLKEIVGDASNESEALDRFLKRAGVGKDNKTTGNQDNESNSD